MKKVTDYLNNPRILNKMNDIPTSYYSSKCTNKDKYETKKVSIAKEIMRILISCKLLINGLTTLKLNDLPNSKFIGLTLEYISIMK